MRIHLDQLKQTRITLEQDTPAERFPALRVLAEAGATFTGLVQTRVTAERVGELVEVRGLVRASARQSCSRCLVEFTAPVEADFELTYARQAEGSDGAGDAPRPDAPPDDGLIHFHGDEINLTGGVQEHLILALPLKPLCSEACKGLCARCGGDLNQGPCGCAENRTGRPFEALSRLKLPNDV
jgi:uncharacterized protein